MLSIGAGTCQYELQFATSQKFKEVVCVDISEDSLQVGKLAAKAQGLTNMRFDLADFYKLPYDAPFDVDSF